MVRAPSSGEAGSPGSRVRLRALMSPTAPESASDQIVGVEVGVTSLHVRYGAKTITTRPAEVCALAQGAGIQATIMVATARAIGRNRLIRLNDSP